MCVCKFEHIKDWATWRWAGEQPLPALCIINQTQLFPCEYYSWGDKKWHDIIDPKTDTFTKAAPDATVDHLDQDNVIRSTSNVKGATEDAAKAAAQTAAAATAKVHHGAGVGTK